MVDSGSHSDEIHHTLETAFSPNGNLDGNRVSAQAIPQLVIHPEEVGPRPIHFVDKGNARHVVPICLPPNGFRLGLHPAHGAKDGNHAIQHPHRTLNFDGEIDVTGGVNNIDLVISPARGNSGSGNRNASLPLLFHPVGNGGTFVDFTNFMNDPRIIKDSFGGGGFARINVGRNPDISNSL